MLLDSAYYKLGPTLASHSHPYIVMVQAAESLRYSPLSSDFDPMCFFAPHSETLDARLEGLHAQAVLNDKRSNWMISRDGDVVTVEADRQVPDYGQVVNRYRVDIGRGANLRSYEATDPDGSETWQFEFAEQDGIWLPREISIVRANKAPDDKTTRKLEWVESTLNFSSDDRQFALEEMGAATGDRVRDSRSGVEYTFQSDREPAAESAATKADAPRRRLVLIFASLPLALVVLILLLRSRRARRGAAK